MIIYCITVGSGINYKGFKLYCETEEQCRRAIDDIPGKRKQNVSKTIEKLTLRIPDGISNIQAVVRILNDPLGVLESAEVIFSE